MSKFVAIVALIFFFFSIKGLTYSCPEGVLRNRDFAKGIKLLDTIKGKRLLGKCDLEIVVCDANKKTKSSNLFGEIFVKDVYGREQYAPLYYQEVNLKNMTSTIEAHQDSMFYIFKDNIYDALNGEKEKVYLDIRKNQVSHDLEKIDLGIYGTNRRIRKLLFFHTAEWSSCSKL